MGEVELKKDGGLGFMLWIIIYQYNFHISGLKKLLCEDHWVLF